MGAVDQPRPSEALLRDALDTLPIHVAVLDRDGRVLAVNESWDRFTEAHPFVGHRYGVGASFRELCREEVSDCPEEARRVMAGLREVLERSREGFEMEYPCPTPEPGDRAAHRRAARRHRRRLEPGRRARDRPPPRWKG